MAQNSSKDKPTVIIAGAGIGGLMLGALLEQIDIPYHIHERAKEIRPLGSAIGLGASILPIFEQLGLFEDLKQTCLPYEAFHVYNIDMSEIGSLQIEAHKAATGYDFYFISRPKLYELLLRKVPAHRITLGSKVLRTEEKDGKVIVYCSGDTKHEGDILVGADGAYSTVRQSLYKRLDEKGALPEEDLKGLKEWQVSMVGVAKPSDPEKYPRLSEDRSRFHQVIGDGVCDWYVVNTGKDEICWGVVTKISESEAEHQLSQSMGWTPKETDDLINKFRETKCPIGGTMGDIFDATPMHLTSKVVLSEKIFETWYHGRTVLIGDACHKMIPAAGQGAVMAMQDAVILANGLYKLSDYSLDNITAIFEGYCKIHRQNAEQRAKEGAHAAEIMTGQSWQYQLIRYAYLKFMPKWLLRILFKKEHGYQPQITWLPTV
ncbi:hypothetical protein BGX20_008474 [Mortierella sp. AD010]|nr:hypothetical protein BGX20_008474 [Mortierella sp. AD010]